MGLPLFHAPVESDIPSKPAPKNPVDPATTRSPIRRAERRRQLLETRTHRLQLLHALQGSNIELNDVPVSDRDRVPSEPRSRPAEMARAVANDTTRRFDIWNNIDIDFDDDTLARLEEREVGRPERAESSQPPTAALPGPDGLIAGESYIRNDYLRPEGTMDLRDARLWGDYRRSTSREGSTPRRSRDVPYVAGRLRPPVLHRQSSYESASARARNPDPGEYLNEYHRRRRNLPDTAPRSRRRYGRYVRYLDGLGDRERSPEDDSAWDTLQSSITPDPQPPSVGSSFASTVSAAASQTTANSSNTSVTNPDEEVEPPCDPVDLDAGGGSDEDRDADDGRSGPARRPTPHGGRRSYAAVAADTLLSVDDDGNDSLEWLSEMQRIVQGLASRQDIPDQWWAAVGLTRSMTSE